MKSKIIQILKSICYVLLFLGMQLLVSICFSTVYCFKIGMESALNDEPLSVEMFEEKMTAFNLQWGLWMTMIYGILTLLVLWVFFKILKKDFRQETLCRPFARKYILPVILMGIFFCIFISFALGLLPIPESILSSYMQSSAVLTGSQTWVIILAIVIVAPIVEEVIFRGLLLSGLKKALPVPAAVIVSSLLFGLVHGQVLWMSYTFLFGIILSIVVLKTNSTIASICVHMIFNLTGQLLNGLVTSDTVSAIICAVSFCATALTILAFVRIEESARIDECEKL